MNAQQIARLLLEDVYSKSTTQINLPEDMANFIQLWGQLNIPDDLLYIDPKDGGKGRESEMHVTVLYGFSVPAPPPALYQVVESTPPFVINLLTISIFESAEYDVVKLGVDSPELHKLHQRLKASAPNEQTFPTYNPHCTLAYVKKGAGQQFVGMNPFGEAGGFESTFNAMSVLFKGAGDSEDPARVVEEISMMRQMPETAPEGMAYQVVWQDGAAVQYFAQHSDAIAFSKEKENGAEPPKLVDRPQGEVKESGSFDGKEWLMGQSTDYLVTWTLRSGEKNYLASDGDRDWWWEEHPGKATLFPTRDLAQRVLDQVMLPKHYQVEIKPLLGESREPESRMPAIEAHRSGDDVWLDMFRVPKSLRRQGLGTEAYRRWEASLPPDVLTIRLMAADTGDGPSDEFWRKLGFVYRYDDPGLPYEHRQEMEKTLRRRRPANESAKDEIMDMPHRVRIAYKDAGRTFYWTGKDWTADKWLAILWGTRRAAQDELDEKPLVRSVGRPEAIFLEPELTTTESEEVKDLILDEPVSYIIYWDRSPRESRYWGGIKHSWQKSIEDAEPYDSDQVPIQKGIAAGCCPSVFFDGFSVRPEHLKVLTIPKKAPTRQSVFRQQESKAVKDLILDEPVEYVVVLRRGGVTLYWAGQTTWVPDVQNALHFSSDGHARASFINVWSSWRTKTFGLQHVSFEPVVPDPPGDLDQVTFESGPVSPFDGLPITPEELRQRRLRSKRKRRATPEKGIQG